MALKDIWVDKSNGVDVVDADNTTAYLNGASMTRQKEICD